MLESSLAVEMRWRHVYVAPDGGVRTLARADLAGDEGVAALSEAMSLCFVPFSRISRRNSNPEPATVRRPFSRSWTMGCPSGDLAYLPLYSVGMK